MAFLAGTFLGTSILSGATATPSPSAFDKLTIYGEGVIDKIWVRNRAETSAYISALTVDNYTATWDTDTVFLADFEDSNLNAGNVANLTSDITNFIIKFISFT